MQTKRQFPGLSILILVLFAIVFNSLTKEGPEEQETINFENESPVSVKFPKWEPLERIITVLQK